MKHAVSEWIPAPRKGWDVGAECRNRDPELWWASDKAEQDYAKNVCRLDCAVRRECGLSALRRGETFGIWAGHDLADPRDMRRLAADLGVGAPRRPREKKVLVRNCTDCEVEFTVRDDRVREKCKHCAVGRMPAKLPRAFIDDLARQGLTYQRIADLAGAPVTRAWVAHTAAGASDYTSAEHVRALFSISLAGVAS